MDHDYKFHTLTYIKYIFCSIHVHYVHKKYSKKTTVTAIYIFGNIQYYNSFPKIVPNIIKLVCPFRLLNWI